MEAGGFELMPIEFTEEERHYSMIIMFVKHNIDSETTKVAEMTGVPLRTVQKIKKLFCETRYP